MTIRSIRSRIIFLSSLCLVIMGTVIIIYAVTYVRNSSVRRANDQIRFLAQDCAEHVRDKFDRSMECLNVITTILEKVKDPIGPLNINREHVDTMLQSVLEQNKNIVGVYTCWQPNAFDDEDKYYENEPEHGKTGRFSHYWYRNRYGHMDVEPLKHVDEGGANSLGISHKEIKQAFVTGPHIHTVGGKEVLVASLVVPVLLHNNFYGIVGIDIGVETLQGIADETEMSQKDAHIIILSADGKIAGTTGRSDLLGEDASKIVEDMDRYNKEISIGKKFIGVFQNSLKFFSPIEITNSKPWWVIVSIPETAITAEARGLSRHLIFVGLGFIIVSVLIFRLFANSIVKPLKSLVKGVKDIGRGNYGGVIEVGSQDEIGELASAFNTMSIKIKARELERDQAEELLRESEERYRIVADFAHDWEYWIGPDGDFEYISPSCEKITGYAPDDFFKKPSLMLSIVHEADRQTVLDHLKSDNNHCPHIRTVDYRIITSDGQVKWLNNYRSSVFAEDGTFLGRRASNRDITERKLSEQKLEESEVRFRELFDNMSSGVAIYGSLDNGQSFVFKDLNKAGLEYGQKRKEEVLGNDVREVFPGVEELGLFDVFKRVWKTGDPEHHPSSVYEDGKLMFWVENYICKLPSGELVAIYDDTTTRMKAEAERKRLETQLQQAQKMEAIGTLAGGIAHDFNNILAAIIMLSELSMLETPEGSSLHRHVEKILEAGMRAKNLVRQILAFSRQKDQERIPMSIAPVINEALKLLRSSLPSTIKIKHHIKKDPELIQGDPTQIHQVVMNLCTNAEHAMREKGGVLDVKLERVDVDEGMAALHRALQPGPYMRLEVKDTGYGIEPAGMERIFDPYFTTKGVGEGTGLGLAVVQGIMHKHGGSITVESEVGKGTIFVLFFPVIEGEKKEIEEKNEASLSTGGERILFIDDEEVLAETAKEILELLGYKVTIKTSSVEALELFKAKPGYFDLVITDMSMPNMTGEQLSREVMKIRPELPIILCTGFSHIISKEKAHAIGIKAFVMKPLVRKDLAEMVRRVLDQKNGTDV